jgi:hypothetical protein
MAPLPKVKLRAPFVFPAAVASNIGIKITKENGKYWLDLDWSALQQVSAVAPDQFGNTVILSYNIVDGSFALLPFNVAVSDKIIIEKTDAGDVNVGPYDGIILVNKDTPEATTIDMPAASSKIGSVKIVDFAGNAGTYNITITPDGSDTINGQSQWVISGDGASVVLDPVPGGWAL